MHRPGPAVLLVRYREPSDELAGLPRTAEKPSGPPGPDGPGVPVHDTAPERTS